MRKTMKKVTSAALVAAMTVGCLAGCGSNGGSSVGDTESGGSSAASSDKTITLTVFSELANYSGEQVGWSAKILKDKFNVVLNIIPEQDGVYETRMESGDLGDIVVWGSDGENYSNAVKAGLLYDWNEDDLLEEYGPYIAENMPQALEKNANLTSTITNGESDAVYGFGHDVATSSENHAAFFYTWDLRWDLYKELGYPQINNLDDLLEVLKQMKDICPTDDNGKETYAVSLWPDWDKDMVMYVKSLATAYYGYDESCGLGLYDPETGTLHDTLEEDGPYLEALKFFNKLYQNNLLDPNSMTQTYDNMIEKVQSGGTFWSIFNYSGSAGYNSETHLNDNKMMLSVVPSEASPIVYGMSVMGGNRIWSIGANTQYPELCMEIINWLCTPEGRMTYQYGPQELCWYYDEDGYTHFTDFGKTVALDRTTAMSSDWGGGTFNDGCLQINNTTWSLDAVNPDSAAGERFNYEFWKSYQTDAANETEQDWRDYYGVSSVQEYMEKQNYVVAPSTTYTEAAKSDDFKTTWSAVTEAIITYSWRAIYANSDEEYDQIVAEMIEQANSYGYEECLEWSLEQAATRHALEEEVR
jgi:multiple sugar transport system substrate-binding protein/putative aldouronate transport system substrate-binding protein